MSSKLLAARLAQFSFLGFGACAMLMMFLNVGGRFGFMVPIIMASAALLYILTFRCKNCGVSYYFSPKGISPNLSGVNLLKLVRSQCPNCGANRD